MYDFKYNHTFEIGGEVLEGRLWRRGEVGDIGSIKRGTKRVFSIILAKNDPLPKIPNRYM